MKRILNIGSGTEKRKKDTINLDKKKLPNVDVVWNLEKTPLPFKNNYFEEIICNHVLEHIENFLPLMEEFWRLLKHNGTIKIRVPYFASPSTFMHPDHKRFFTYKSFDYWFKSNPQHYEVTEKAFFVYNRRELRLDKKFQLIGMQKLANKFPMFYEVMLSHIFPAGEIYFELKKE